MTVKAVPPGTDAPAAGTVNSTSARARGAVAARKKRAADGRIAIVLKRVTVLYFRGRIEDAGSW